MSMLESGICQNTHVYIPCITSITNTNFIHCYLWQVKNPVHSMQCTSALVDCWPVAFGGVHVTLLMSMGNSYSTVQTHQYGILLYKSKNTRALLQDICYKHVKAFKSHVDHEGHILDSGPMSRCYTSHTCHFACAGDLLASSENVTVTVRSTWPCTGSYPTNA